MKYNISDIKNYKMRLIFKNNQEKRWTIVGWKKLPRELYRFVFYRLLVSYTSLFNQPVYQSYFNLHIPEFTRMYYNILTSAILVWLKNLDPPIRFNLGIKRNNLGNLARSNIDRTLASSRQLEKSFSRVAKHFVGRTSARGLIGVEEAPIHSGKGKRNRELRWKRANSIQPRSRSDTWTDAFFFAERIDRWPFSVKGNAAIAAERLGAISRLGLEFAYR